MRVGKINASEFISGDRRLNGSYYLSEDELAMRTLRRWRGRFSTLREVTLADGIYNGGIFRMIEAADGDHGQPYVSAKDLVMADIVPKTFLSNSHGQLLDKLRLHEGTILLTCSGMNLGKSIWVRPELEGLCASGDLIRIQADSSIVPPGYLHAFLSSRFGWVSVRQLIFGGNIKHVEPEAVSKIRIPRLKPDVETKCHELVARAGRERSIARIEINEAISELSDAIGLRQLSCGNISSYGTSTVSASELNSRFDATYHARLAQEAMQAVSQTTAEVRLLKSVTERMFKPPMFKRLWVTDPKFGRQFVSGNNAYRYYADDPRYVSTRTPSFEEFILKNGWLVFQAAGQVYGLFGKPLLVSGWLDGTFCADDIYRVVPRTPQDGAYLYAFLKTGHGEILLKRQASGNSIPRVWDPQMHQLTVPWAKKQIRDRIGNKVLAAHLRIEDARLNEQEAVHLVERVIEEAS
ncbi:MAG: hypothetical protein ABJZ55_15140 [Fuerstiella sp.]